MAPEPEPDSRECGLGRASEGWRKVRWRTEKEPALVGTLSGELAQSLEGWPERCKPRRYLKGTSAE